MEGGEQLSRFFCRTAGDGDAQGDLWCPGFLQEMPGVGSGGLSGRSIGTVLPRRVGVAWGGFVGWGRQVLRGARLPLGSALFTEPSAMPPRA